MSSPTVKTMRDALIEQIYEEMKKNDKIFFLSADFGAPALDKIRQKLEDRYRDKVNPEQKRI